MVLFALFKTISSIFIVWRLLKMLALQLWRDWLVTQPGNSHTNLCYHLGLEFWKPWLRSALLEGSNQLEWEQSYIPARHLIKPLVCCLQNSYVNPGLWGIQAMPGICNCEKNGTVRGSTTKWILTLLNEATSGRQSPGETQKFEKSKPYKTFLHRNAVRSISVL